MQQFGGITKRIKRLPQTTFVSLPGIYGLSQGSTQAIVCKIMVFLSVFRSHEMEQYGLYLPAYHRVRYLHILRPLLMERQFCLAAQEDSGYLSIQGPRYISADMERINAIP